MSKDTFQKRPTPTSVKPMVWLAVGGLVLIVGISLIVGTIAWSQNPAKDTLGYELAKTSMQVVGVTLIGAVAAIAAFAIQQSIADKVSQLAEGREDSRVHKRREEDFNRERRRRQDDLVSTMLNDTVDAYHRIKNIRRSLQASVGRSSENLSIEDYDKWLPEVSAQQLVFEELKRLAPLANDALAGLAPASVPRDNDKYGSDDKSIGAEYQRIEGQLNTLLSEYQKTRNDLKKAGSMSIRDPRLAELKKFVLYPAVSIAHIVEVLRKSLLRPA
jgi:hypothetical protein